MGVPKITPLKFPRPHYSPSPKKMVAANVARELDATSDAIDEGQLEVLISLLFTQSSVYLS